MCRWLLNKFIDIFLSYQVIEFFFFAALIFVVTIVFTIMSFFYKYVDLTGCDEDLLTMTPPKTRAVPSLWTMGRAWRTRSSHTPLPLRRTPQNQKENRFGTKVVYQVMGLVLRANFSTCFFYFCLFCVRLFYALLMIL